MKNEKKVMSAEAWLMENHKDSDYNRLTDSINDSIWTNNAIGYLRDFAQYYHSAMQEPPEDVSKAIEAKWISVTERLPEDELYVTVATNSDVWIVPRFYKNGYWYEYGSSCTRQDYTHWQPLPPASTK